MSPSSSRRILVLLALAAALGATVPRLDPPLNVRLDEDQELVSSGYLGEIRFTEDGTRVVYEASSPLGAPLEQYLVPVDGSAPAVQLTSTPAGVSRQEVALSSDGEYLVATEVVGGGVNEWSLKSLALSTGIETVLAGPFPFPVQTFQISPDSTQVLFRAGVIGPSRYELLRVPIDGGPWTRVNAIGPSGGDVREGWRCTSDGSRVVYVADFTTNNVWELYSARLDTVETHTTLSGPAIANSEVEAFWIAPDEQSVVYTANHAGLGRRELFSAPIDGSAPAVEIGDWDGGREALDVAVTSDASTVVFRADRDVNNRYELYRVPLAGGATPVRLSQAFSTGDVDAFVLSPDDSTVVFRGDLDTAEPELWSVPLVGGAPQPVNDPLPTGGSVEEFAVTADSARIVYRADQNVALRSELFSAPLDASQAPVGLNLAPVAGGSVQSPWELTADGASVVFRADLDTAGQVELYRASVLGADVSHQRLSAPLPTRARDVLSFQLATDGLRATYLADVFANGDYDLFSVPLDASVAPVQLNAPFPLVPSGGAVQAVHVGDGRIAYRSSSNTWNTRVHVTALDGSGVPTLLSDPGAEDGTSLNVFFLNHDATRVQWLSSDPPTSFSRELFSAPLDASAPPTRVTLGLVDTALDPYYGLSPASDQVAFVTSSLQQLYVAPLDGSAAPLVVYEDTVEPNPLRALPLFTQDGSRVVFRAIVGGQARLFSVPADGSAPATLLTPSPPAGQEVGLFSLAPPAAGGGARVVFAQGSVLDEWDLFVVPVDGSAAPVRLNGAVKLRHNSQYGAGYTQVTGDGTSIVYRAGPWGDEELLVAPLDGTQTLVSLNDPVPGTRETTSFALLPDQATIVFATEQPGGTHGLYRAPLDGATPAVLIADLGNSSDVDPVVSPDGAWIVYRAWPVVPLRDELFSVPVDGSAPPVRLSGPITSGGEVQSFRIAPTSDYVLFEANPDDPQRRELFAVPIDGSAAPEVVNGDLGPGGTVLASGAALGVSADGRTVTYFATQASGGGLFASRLVPALESVSPAQGSPLGGTRVTVLGSGFDSTTTVTFDGVPATSVTWVSTTQLEVRVPPRVQLPVPPRGPRGAGRARPFAGPHTVDVVVRRGFFEERLPGAFTYLAH